MIRVLLIVAVTFAVLNLVARVAVVLSGGALTGWDQLMVVVNVLVVLGGGYMLATDRPR